MLKTKSSPLEQKIIELSRESNLCCFFFVNFFFRKKSFPSNTFFHEKKNDVNLRDKGNDFADSHCVYQYQIFSLPLRRYYNWFTKKLVSSALYFFCCWLAPLTLIELRVKKFRNNKWMEWMRVWTLRGDKWRVLRSNYLKHFCCCGWPDSSFFFQFVPFFSFLCCCVSGIISFFFSNFLQ